MKKRNKRKARRNAVNPVGYPYLLFKVCDPNPKGDVVYKFVKAATPVSALKEAKIKNGDVSIASLTEIIKTFGHSETSKMLQGIDKSWISKQDTVFYKPSSGNKVIRSIV